MNFFLINFSNCPDQIMLFKLPSFNSKTTPNQPIHSPSLNFSPKHFRRYIPTRCTGGISKIYLMNPSAAHIGTAEENSPLQACVHLHVHAPAVPGNLIKALFRDEGLIDNS